VPDAVQDGLTGFLFDPADAHGIVSTVERALSSRCDLDAIRLRARQDVEQRSWERATEQLRKHYLQIILNRRLKEPRRPQGWMKRISSRSALRLLRFFLP
jgi:glycosyltransferase involved in cell wall biosynthesis